MEVGDARQAEATERTVRINGGAASVEVTLRFEPGRSLLVRLRGETVTIEGLDEDD